MITILFLAADPTDASRLRLGEEAREIQEKLQLSRLRDNFILHQRFSTRPSDISQSLLDLSPQILHFSGHGTSTGALCFENKMGEIHPVKPASLAALFEQFSPELRCVLLNACYSATQAEAIAKHIDYVIGMNHAIGDKAAIAFAVGFYQALAAGRAIETAYELGRVQIDMENIPENLTPVLIKKRNSSKYLIKNKEPKPEIESPGIQEYLECPLCGRFNKQVNTFRCRICQRPHICIAHLNEKFMACDGCLGEITSLIDTYYGLLQAGDLSTSEKEEAFRLNLESVSTRTFARKIDKKMIKDLFSYRRDDADRFFAVDRYYKECTLNQVVLRQNGSLLITVTITMVMNIFQSGKDMEEKEIHWNYQYLLAPVDGVWKIEQEFARA